MVQISLKIYINEEELEQDNIIEKNIKIEINDSDKIDNIDLIKIHDKNLIIKTEELKKELKNVNKNNNEEKNNKHVNFFESLKKTKTHKDIDNNNDFFNKKKFNRIYSSKFSVENKFNRLNLKIKNKQNHKQKGVFNLDSKFLSYNFQKKKDEKFNINFIEKFMNDKIDETSNIFKYIFFGESKCGKTMLINNFIHYIKNISYYNEKRFSINLEELNDLKEYKIKSNRVNFPSVILIDTPPLEKIKDNKNLIEKINNYKNLNGIIFVLKNSDTKLHDEAKYFINIFENIIKNLNNKIYIMGTFFDAQKNLEYLKDEEIFKNIKIIDILYFNNNCLFTINKNSKENWRRNYDNFNNFFYSNDSEEEDNDFFFSKKNKKAVNLFQNKRNSLLGEIANEFNEIEEEEKDSDK